MDTREPRIKPAFLPERDMRMYISVALFCHAFFTGCTADSPDHTTDSKTTKPAYRDGTLDGVASAILNGESFASVVLKGLETVPATPTEPSWDLYVDGHCEFSGEPDRARRMKGGSSSMWAVTIRAKLTKHSTGWDTFADHCEPYIGATFLVETPAELAGQELSFDWLPAQEDFPIDGATYEFMAVKQVSGFDGGQRTDTFSGVGNIRLIAKPELVHEHE